MRFIKYSPGMGEYMTVAAYVRVSTADQNLSRQLEATHDYAVDELGVEPPLSKCTATSLLGQTSNGRATSS
jgi:hypothetical protein